MARQELRCLHAAAQLGRQRLQRTLRRWRASAAARARLRERACTAGAPVPALQLSWAARQQLVSELGPGGLAASHWRARRLRGALAAWARAASGCEDD